MSGKLTHPSTLCRTVPFYYATVPRVQAMTRSTTANESPACQHRPVSATLGFKVVPFGLDVEALSPSLTRVVASRVKSADICRGHHGSHLLDRILIFAPQQFFFSSRFWCTHTRHTRNTIETRIHKEKRLQRNTLDCSSSSLSFQAPREEESARSQRVGQILIGACCIIFWLTVTFHPQPSAPCVDTPHSARFRAST